MASRGPNMTAAEIATAMAMRANGIPLKAVSKALGRAQTHISTRLSKELALQSTSVLGNYKEDLKQKSVESLRVALTRGGKDYDRYKAGGLAVQVLKGIGEFKDEQVQGLTITISNAPRGLEPETIDVTPEPAETASQGNDTGENLPVCDERSQNETE